MPVPDFSPGEVLTAAAMDSVGLWLVKTQTIGTGVLTVTVTGAFSADWNNYLITVSDTTISTGDRIKMTINGSAGSTYRHGGYRFQYSANALNGEGGNDQPNWSVALPGAAGKISGQIFIQNPFNAVPTVFNSHFAGLTFAFHQMGVDTNTASSTAFTLDPDGATTLTGGTIRVYGYRN
jgi:hypothetical protein